MSNVFSDHVYMNVMDRQTLLSAKPRDCPTVPWDGEDIRAEERVSEHEISVWLSQPLCVGGGGGCG